MKIKTIALWIFRILAAVIMLQSLYFKFTGQPVSKALFSQIHMEPEGRIGIGILELIASLLLLIPGTTAFGALLGMGLMAGAIYFHLSVLGISYGGDAGLFTYAVIAFLCCLILTIFYLPFWMNVLKRKSKV